MAIYYKGFNRDLTCRGFQFKEGETYREENASLCHSGFHACERPLDTFTYYNPGTSVYHEVELNDVSDERRSDDTKVCAKEIKIGARLNIPALVSAHIEYIKKNCTSVKNSKKAANAGDFGAANAGNCGAANAGDFGAANAGYRGAANAGGFGAANAGNCGAANAGNCGAANAGDFGAANAGDCGAANAGDFGAANAGDRGAANAGDRGAANAGNCGAANAGDRGAATSGGRSSVGKNGIAIARGDGCVRVKGGLGSILVIAIEEEDSFKISDMKCVYVDGEKIKADVWYKLDHGEFEEVCEA